MPYKIKIDIDAHLDIQEGVDWYNEQSPGLGRRFHSVIKSSINRLKINPFYQIRYGNMHCLPLKKYPYMIHFTIDENQKEVTVRAIFNTSRDPEIWKRKK